ncbi:MAG: hypothetical protein JSU96_02770 [Acidobacteriota bacterium]|nr:MAG: hypothetical protein JSU96_02770 [Acidobacteriota bacterium]
MWKLVFSELRYNGLHAGFTLGIVIVFPFLARMEIEDFAPALLLYFIVFITLNNIHSFRMKEKHERLYAALPLPLWQIGLSRLLVLLFPAVLAYGVYLFTAGILGTPFEIRTILISFGFVLVMLSVFVLIRDIAFFSPRLTQILDLKKVLLVMSLGLGVLAILGLVIMVGPGQPFIGVLIDTLIEHNPFKGPVGNSIFILLSLALISSSVLTFNCRRSYLE